MSARERGIVSPLLQHTSAPVQTVVSGVYRMASPSSAAAYVRAAASPRGLRCIEQAEARKGAALPAGARGRIGVAALLSPLGSADVAGARRWRCLAGAKPCSGARAGSFTDRIWFASGPYVVALFYIVGARNEAKGSDLRALPLERRLVALLHDRAARAARGRAA